MSASILQEHFKSPKGNKDYWQKSLASQASVYSSSPKSDLFDRKGDTEWLRVSKFIST